MCAHIDHGCDLPTVNREQLETSRNVGMINYMLARSQTRPVMLKLESTLAHEAIHSVTTALHDDGKAGGSSAAASFLMAAKDVDKLVWIEEQGVIKARALSEHSKIEIHTNTVPLMAMLPLSELFHRRLLHPSVWVKSGRYNCLMSEWMAG